MKDFNTLTRRGKSRRLRALAMNALQQYPLDVAKIRLLGMYTNTLFRIDTTDKKTYVIRICAPYWRTDDDLRSEAMWLDALRQNSDIHAPVPLRANNGDWLVTAEAAGVIPCRCLVMSWIPGKPLGRHLTETNLYRMGQLFARLHMFSAEFMPEEGFTLRKMNKVLARDEPDLLFSEAMQSAFNPHSLAICKQAWEKVNDAYEKLYADPANLRVIHHDLHHDNIHLYRGYLYPLDFEDTCWGYPIQDIAMAMQDLMQDVEPERFDPLLAQFRAGYTSLLPWAEQYESQMDTFRVGRMFWVANYIARHEPDYLETYLDRITPLFENFLKTGKLRLAPTS